MSPPNCLSYHERLKLAPPPSTLRHRSLAEILGEHNERVLNHELEEEEEEAALCREALAAGCLEAAEGGSGDSPLARDNEDECGFTDKNVNNR